METKWFKTQFKVEDANFPEKKKALSDYIENKKLLNTDESFIDWFLRPLDVMEINIVIKTNNSNYINEIKKHYQILEISKPNDLIEEI